MQGRGYIQIIQRSQLITIKNTNNIIILAYPFGAATANHWFADIFTPVALRNTILNFFRVGGGEIQLNNIKLK